MIKETRTCPFGHECIKTTKDGIERCMLYVTVHGTDEMGKPTERSNCAIVVSVQIGVQSVQTGFNQQAVMEQARNTLQRATGEIHGTKTLTDS